MIKNRSLKISLLILPMLLFVGWSEETLAPKATESHDAEAKMHLSQAEKYSEMGLPEKALNHAELAIKKLENSNDSLLIRQAEEKKWFYQKSWLIRQEKKVFLQDKKIQLGRQVKFKKKAEAKKRDTNNYRHTSKILQSTGYRGIVTRSFQKKVRTLHRHHGEINVYGLSSLFHSPDIREAYVVPYRHFYAESDFSYISSGGDNENADFESHMDFSIYTTSFKLFYGLSKNIEIGLRARYSFLDGDLSLIQKSVPRNLVDDSSAKPGIDDVDLEITYLIGKEKKDKESLLLRISSFPQNPFNLAAQQISQTISLASKLPTGDTGQFLSSGAADYTLSLRSSYKISDLFYVDTGWHYTLTGDIDYSLFKGIVRSKNFFSTDYSFSFFRNINYYYFVAFAYNSAKTDGPFDVYKSDGPNFKFGLRMNRLREKYIYFPSVNFTYRNAQNLGMQFVISAAM